MSDEEILKKYEIKIKQGIKNIVEEYKINDSAKIELVAQKYTASFVTGFKEGKEE